MSAPSASELLHWGDLEGRRRRAARGTTGLLSWPPIVALALSVLLGLELWRRTTLVDPNIGPIGFSLFAIAFAEILTVFGTPYRMYWRDDSALLARLAIDGGTLFELAYRRCFRAAGLALLPAVAAVVVIATQGFAEVALRLGVVAIAGAVLAGALAPAASLAGGAIVASDKAQAMIDSFGGETKPPGVTWLGALPGLVAMAVALLLMTTRDWIIGIDPFVSTGLFTCIAAIVAAAAAFLWAVRAAPEILIDAQREVAALDQVRLAHIDRSHAGPIERLWGALTCRSQSARLVYNKDAALMRRRYPAPYFVAFLAIALTWILAATSYGAAALVVICSLAAYAVVMAHRHASQPVELPRLLRSLPLATSSASAAKRSAAILRAVVWVAVPGASVIVFADNTAAAVVVPAAALAFSLVIGERLAVERGAR